MDASRAVAAQLAKLFLRRFDPDEAHTLSEREYAESLASTLKEIEAGTIEDEQSKQLLRAMTSAAKHTLRTNVHVGDRWALCLRLDPGFFESILPPVSSGFSNLPCDCRSF